MIDALLSSQGYWEDRLRQHILLLIHSFIHSLADLFMSPLIHPPSTSSIPRTTEETGCAKAYTTPSPSLNPRPNLGVCANSQQQEPDEIGTEKCGSTEVLLAEGVRNPAQGRRQLSESWS